LIAGKRRPGLRAAGEPVNAQHVKSALKDAGKPHSKSGPSQHQLRTKPAQQAATSSHQAATKPAQQSAKPAPPVASKARHHKAANRRQTSRNACGKACREACREGSSQVARETGLSKRWKKRALRAPRRRPAESEVNWLGRGSPLNPCWAGQLKQSPANLPPGKLGFAGSVRYVLTASCVRRMGMLAVVSNPQLRT